MSSTNPKVLLVRRDSTNSVAELDNTVEQLCRKPRKFRTNENMSDAGKLMFEDDLKCDFMTDDNLFRSTWFNHDSTFLSKLEHKSSLSTFRLASRVDNNLPNKRELKQQEKKRKT